MVNGWKNREKKGKEKFSAAFNNTYANNGCLKLFEIIKHLEEILRPHLILISSVLFICSDTPRVTRLYHCKDSRKINSDIIHKNIYREKMIGKSLNEIGNRIRKQATTKQKQKNGTLTI